MSKRAWLILAYYGLAVACFLALVGIAVRLEAHPNEYPTRTERLQALGLVVAALGAWMRAIRLQRPLTPGERRARRPLLTLLLACASLAAAAQVVDPALPDSATANYQFPPGTTVTGDFPRMEPHSVWSWGSEWEETINGPAPSWATYAERRGWYNGWSGYTYSSADTARRPHAPGPDSTGRWVIYNFGRAVEVQTNEPMTLKTHERLTLALYLTTLACILVVLGASWYYHFLYWDRVLSPKQRWELFPTWPLAVAAAGLVVHWLNASVVRKLKPY